jgi:predicted dehydrogenase
MIDAVNNNTKPLIDGKEGKKGMSIILAAYKSRLTGMPVKFPMGDFSTLDMLGIEKINN